MPLIIPVGFAQLVYTYSFEGDEQPMVNTMGVDISDFGGTGEELAHQALDDWGANVMPYLTDIVTLEGVTAYIGQNVGPPTIEEWFTTPVEGGIGSAPNLPNTALLVRKRTGNAGRRGRGRIYVPGSNGAQINNVGLFSDIYVEGAQSHMDNLLLVMTTPPGDFGPYPPVILHRSEGAGAEPPPTPVTAFVVEKRAATQRRRLRP